MSLVLLAACAAPPPANAPPPQSNAASDSTAKADPALAGAATGSADHGLAAAPPEPEPAPLPKGTRVLQIGDSFADALGGKLSKMFRAVEVKTDLEFETPSYIPNWSYGAKLPKLLSSYRPDLVLITLGANEIE
ncbi:MAG TPA: hypothetical protein VGJ91_00195, partial [Polyangiaceae bacterium]